MREYIVWKVQRTDSEWGTFIASSADEAAELWASRFDGEGREDSICFGSEARLTTTNLTSGKVTPDNHRGGTLCVRN